MPESEQAGAPPADPVCARAAGAASTDRRRCELGTNRLQDRRGVDEYDLTFLVEIEEAITKSRLVDPGA